MKKIKLLLSVLLTVCIFIPLCVVPAGAEGKWVAAWTTSIVNGSVNVSGISLQDIIPAKSTVRTEITVTTGGTKLRFRFSNQFGSAPITINEASVARTDTKASAKIIDGTQTKITFNDGKSSVEIGAGKAKWSDEIEFKTEALDKLSVSLYFENLTYITSTGLSNGKSFLDAGSLLFGGSSKVKNTSLSSANEINISSGSITYHTIPFLCMVDTQSESSDACAAVFIGDSTLVNDASLDFAIKAVEAGAKNIGIVNEAIIGNKLLSGGTGLLGKLYGISLSDRFNRDVLKLSGVKYCFVKIGLNDILHQYTKSMAASTPKFNAQDIIDGYTRLIERCHENNIKIYFFTKTPWNGYERSFLGQDGDLTWNAEAQAMCDELDAWIRSGNGSDGFIDCSPLADPSDKTKLCSTLTTDGAHLTSLGAVALADLIPLSYIGINEPAAMSAAEIMGVDPYAEKRQIEENMNNAPATDPSSQGGEESTTLPEESTETPASEAESTTAAPATEPTAPTTTVPFTPPTTAAPDATQAYTPYITSETTTTAYPAYTEPRSYDPPEYVERKDVNYVVSDVDVDTIGTDAPIGFILILFTSIVAASAVIILTIGKKKEQF